MLTLWLSAGGDMTGRGGAAGGRGTDNGPGSEYLP